MFPNDLQAITDITDSALKAVEEGQFSRARSILSRLNNCPLTSEAEAARVLVQGLIFLKRRKKTKARKLILDHNFAAWSDPDLLYLLRMTNPPVERTSRLFEITFMGGCASFGMFTQFSPEHVSTLSVIANDQLEALNHIRALCRFNDETTLKILRSGNFDCPEGEEFRGVVRTSPFKPLHGEGFPPR